MSLEIDGMDNLQRNILSQLKRISGAEERIVMAGAEIEYEGIKRDIFVDTGKARDTLSIGKPYKEKGATYVNIGWPEGAKVAYRVHFVEWGTVHIQPQQKITRAIEKTKTQKINAMKRVMKREYGL